MPLMGHADESSSDLVRMQNCATATGKARELGAVAGGLSVFGLMMVLTYKVTLDEGSMPLWGDSGDSGIPVLVLWGTGIAVGVMLRMAGSRVWAAGGLVGTLGAVIACLGVLVYWISLGS